MKQKMKESLKTLRGYGTAMHRIPVLTATAARHIVLPAGFRYVGSLRENGVKDAHWKTLGDGLVRFFQESGPVLTKLGQILATRSDLLPGAVCERLEVLYDRQPPMNRRELDRLLHAAYGDELPFAEFDDKPIAVGSVGQVHRARLEDGSRVIVKLVRPKMDRKIRRDTETLLALTGISEALGGQGLKGTHQMIRRLLEDLKRGFLSELNLKGEAQAMEMFRKRLRRNSRVYIPKVYKELSSKNVLVVEELHGQPLSKFRERSRGSDAKASKALAELALREILTQIFDEGSFHADPHAGNFLVLDDGRLGLIDFGLTGEFTGSDRKKIGKAVKALMARDADAVIKSLLEFGTTPKNFNLEKFKKEIIELVGKKKGAAKNGDLSSTKLDQLVNDLFAITYKHHVYVPPSTTLLIKTLVTIEGVARSLDPEIKLLTVAVPVILRSLTPRWLRFFS